MQRGDLYRLRKPAGDTKRSRVMLVVSRNVFVESPFSTVICAPVYSADRALETEVLVGVDEGLKHSSVVTCDALLSVQKRQLTDYVGSLGPVRLVELGRALRVALALEEDCRLVDHENACLADELRQMGKTVAHLSTEVGVLRATLREASELLGAAADALYADIPAADIDALHAAAKAMGALIKSANRDTARWYSP